MSKFLEFYKKHMSIFFILSFAIVFILILFTEHYTNTPIYHKKISDIAYDSSSLDKNLSTLKKFQIRDFDVLKYDKDVKISLNYKKYKDNHDHPNLFQTADGDNGLRLEYYSDINSAFAVFDNNELNVTDLLKTKDNIFYNFKVEISKNNILSLYLNNDKYSETTLKKGDYKINNVVVGCGHDSLRKFDGNIQDFSLDYSVYHNHNFRVLTSIIIAIFLIHMLFILIYQIKAKKIEDKISIKCFISTSLLVAYPVIFLYLKNILEMDFGEFFEFTFCCILISTIFYFILKRFMLNIQSSLIIIISFVLFYFGGNLMNFVTSKSFIGVGAFYQLCINILLLIYFIVLKIKTDKEIVIKTFSFFIIVLYALLLTTNINAIKSKILLSIHENTQIGQNIINKKNMPNIYFILLDSYPNSEMTKKYFNLNNDYFLNQLQGLGFYVSHNSYSSYNCTKYSLPSMLNYSYLEELPIFKSGIPKNEDIKYEKLLKLYKSNRLVSILKKYNYTIFYINLRKMLTENFNGVDKFYTLHNSQKSAISLKTSILETSIIKNTFIEKKEDNIRKATIDSFVDIEDALGTNTQTPKFVFAHVLCPHGPFVFEENGDKPAVPNLDFVKNPNQPKDAPDTLNSVALQKQMMFLNKKTIKTLAKITQKDKKAVIILISDHGMPFYDVNTTNKKYRDWRNADLNYSNLMAVYVPDRNYKDFNQHMSNLMLIRKILNRYFDMNLDTNLRDIRLPEHLEKPYKVAGVN